MIRTFDSCSSRYASMSVRVKNDLILKMTPETGRKHFITSQKLDCLAQHPKKPTKSKSNIQMEKINSKINKRQIQNTMFTIV